MYRELVRESSIAEERKWFVSPYRVSISGPSDQRKPIEKGRRVRAHPISALYILNHFAFASIRVYRLRGKRLKKGGGFRGKKKMKTEAYKSVCARLFEGGRGWRRAKNIFDVRSRGPLRLDFIAYTDMADLATVCQIYIHISVMYRC